MADVGHRRERASMIRHAGTLAGEPVLDPDEIRELLHCLASERRVATLRTARECRDVRLTGLDADGLLRFSGIEGRVEPSASVEVGSDSMLFRWSLGRLVGDAAPTPGRLFKSARRHERRAPAPAGTTVHLALPSQNGEPRSRRVLDVAHGGISFLALAGDTFAPGRTIPEVTLVFTDGRQLRASAQVRSSQGRRVGLQIWPRGTSDRRVMSRVMDDLLYPNTCGVGVDPWHIYEESGYLNLSGKTPEDFDWLRQTYSRARRTLETTPSIGRVGYWPRHGRAEATVSHLRVYSSAWMICHVSRCAGTSDAEEGRRGLREIYQRLYEQARRQSGTRWWLTYVQDAAPTWSRRVHLDVPAAFVSPREAAVVPFRALEYDVGQGAHLSPSGDHFHVTEAGPLLGRQVMEELVGRRPAPYLKALDLVPERWDLRESAGMWRARGLERERAVLVAFQDDAPVATAVLEVCEPGAHLYGLLDCVRILELGQGGYRARTQLLAAADRWFAARGRRRFVYLAEEPDLLGQRVTSGRDLGGAKLTVLHVDRTAEVLQRVCNLAAARRSPGRAAAG